MGFLSEKASTSEEKNQTIGVGVAIGIGIGFLQRLLLPTFLFFSLH
jgi:hypothetical protein